jgi:hypothetical protein
MYERQSSYNKVGAAVKNLLVSNLRVDSLCIIITIKKGTTKSKCKENGLKEHC